MTALQGLVENRHECVDALANDVHLHVRSSLPREGICPLLAEVVALAVPLVAPVVVGSQARLEVFVQVKQASVVGVLKRTNIWFLVHIDKGKVFFFGQITHGKCSYSSISPRETLATLMRFPTNLFV